MQPTFLTGENKQIHRITLENIAPALISAEIANADEIHTLAAALDQFARDPETILSFPRVFQVWAKR